VHDSNFNQEDAFSDHSLQIANEEKMQRRRKPTNIGASEIVLTWVMSKGIVESY